MHVEFAVRISHRAYNYSYIRMNVGLCAAINLFCPWRYTWLIKKIRNCTRETKYCEFKQLAIEWRFKLWFWKHLHKWQEEIGMVICNNIAEFINTSWVVMYIYPILSQNKYRVTEWLSQNRNLWYTLATILDALSSTQLQSLYSTFVNLQFLSSSIINWSITKLRFFSIMYVLFLRNTVTHAGGVDNAAFINT